MALGHPKLVRVAVTVVSLAAGAAILRVALGRTMAASGSTLVGHDGDPLFIVVGGRETDTKKNRRSRLAAPVPLLHAFVLY